MNLISLVVSIFNYVFYGANFLLSVISLSIPDQAQELINVFKKLWSYLDVMVIPISIAVYIVKFFYHRKMTKDKHWSQYMIDELYYLVQLAIETKDLKLAQHYRYLITLKLINQSNQNESIRDKANPV
ncbi:MAG: hypothetical protein EZS28_027785 [Streblomastix strix]|uniref:Uncharacterized protein n=1 Tax=Streblomastix strix TaxID=222440 RepID=A0A5J4V2R7_9EUKA|nr:MAG: hypothetical protein EZS28_027785 [Streblomastix strix]